MTQIDACMIAEGVEEATQREQLEAWAYLIKTGLAWNLQGWFGRQAASLIDAGIISSTGEINEQLYESLSKEG